MAYFKVFKDSIDDQRIYDLADRIEGEWGLSHLSPTERRQLVGLLVVGVVMRLWAYADTYITSDDQLHVSLSGLSAVLNVPIGVLEKLPPEWLKPTHDGRVMLPGYCKRNHLMGKDERKIFYEKRRAKDRSRKEKARKQLRHGADVARTDNGKGADSTQVVDVRNLSAQLSTPPPVPVPEPLYRDRDRQPSRRAVKARAAAPAPEPRAPRSAEEVERELEAEWQSRFGGKLAAKPESDK